MTAVIQQAAGPVPAGAPLRSEGVWQAAWRRFRKDRVGVVSLIVVAAFLLLILLLPLAVVACGPDSSEQVIKKAEKAGTKAELEKAIGRPTEISKLGPIEQWTYKTKDGQVSFTITGDKVMLASGGTKK